MSTLRSEPKCFKEALDNCNCSLTRMRGLTCLAEQSLFVLGDEASIKITISELGMLDDSSQELDVGRHANHLVLLEREVALLNCRLSVFSVYNQFGNHWIVKRRDAIAFANSRVNSDRIIFGPWIAQYANLARMRQKVVFRVFGVNTCFNRVAD